MPRNSLCSWDEPWPNEPHLPSANLSSIKVAPSFFFSFPCFSFFFDIILILFVLEYKVHSYNRNGLCALGFMDDNYPVRSAFSLLNKVSYVKTSKFSLHSIYCLLGVLQTPKHRSIFISFWLLCTESFGSTKLSSNGIKWVALDCQSSQTQPFYTIIQPMTSNNWRLTQIKFTSLSIILATPGGKNQVLNHAAWFD